ncbi:Z1 domain-containing protein [Porphyromonas gingivalis AJW4]|uniref:Z1 domain-containing protein n=1 Tax=Porphyromonas gingivalis TaxID=837 RepID=UPI0006AA4953|nr:Z1 domain-containing protein [Porphyromonas gingivalis]ALA93049.1 Z1 domain-containing protein [Porphyromonas gingivalis AJW4]
MEIQILNQQEANNFTPAMGERTAELLYRLSEKLDSEEIETLCKETKDILSHCTNPNLDEAQSVTNLVVGYVQSGKTMSFTTLSAMANDNGFRIIIYFAGTKNNLLSQTTKRLRKDLINESTNSLYYKLHENPTNDDSQRIRNELQISTKPTILITVLKHYKYINYLAEIFNSTQLKNALGNKGVLIIDDEADQASLNGYAYKNSQSDEWEEDEYTATYSSILKLRSSIPNHSYIQYTATPQGPLLISIMDLLSPKHHTVLTPGKAYTGGKTFFDDEPGLIITIPDDQVFNNRRNQLSECPTSLIEALQIHLIGVAIVVKILKKEKFLSMMVHADREQDASEKFYGWVKNVIDAWAEMLSCDKNDLARQELIKSFQSNYPEAIREYQKHGEECPSFEEVLGQLNDIILDTNIELIISRNKRQGEHKEIDWNGSPSHVLVGADMLNRGFTVEHLAVTYMPRYSVSKSTADTIQQRCRFFGYKQNYLWSCRVFLPEDTILEYAEYVEHEEEMRKWLKENDSLEAVEHLLLISPRLKATRKNILSKNTVTTKLCGWRKMNAFQTINENTRFVEHFLANTNFTLLEDFNTPDRNHRYVKLPIQQVIEFLSDFKFQNMPDAARKQATLRYMKYLASKDNNPLEHGYIIQMAYSGEPRERTFNPETLKVNNLHTGRSTSGTSVYPGDNTICFEDSICIQIHKVRLKCDAIAWGGKVAYTLAIYYPEDFAINYVETENQI